MVCVLLQVSFGGVQVCMDCEVLGWGVVILWLSDIGINVWHVNNNALTGDCVCGIVYACMRSRACVCV